MSSEDNVGLLRRDALRAGAAGVAALLLPEACSSSQSTANDASAPDVRKDVVKDAVQPSDVNDTGMCGPDYTRKVSIADANIGAQGSWYELSDSCYSDPFCSQDRILLIHPVSKDVYIAMSGSCTHQCNARLMGGCGPAYYKSLAEAGDAGVSEAGADGGAVLTDVIYCDCHGSLYDALTGKVLRGPAAHSLEVLETSVSGGYVVIEIGKK